MGTAKQYVMIAYIIIWLTNVILLCFLFISFNLFFSIVHLTSCYKEEMNTALWRDIV